MPFLPPTTKHVAGFKTRLFLSPLPIPETFNSNNRLRTPARPTHIRTKDPSTVIQLWQNIFATILALEVFLERPTISQPTTNSIPPAMVDSVGGSFPLLLALPFRTIVIVSESYKSNRRLPDLPGQGVPMIPPHLSNQGYHTPISLLLTISRTRGRHSRRRNLLTRTNTPTTIYPTNPQNATVRGTLDHTRGHTIPRNEMSPIITVLLSPITPSLSHLPGLRDPHPFKPRPSPAARTETERDSTITRGWALRRT